MMHSINSRMIDTRQAILIDRRCTVVVTALLLMLICLSPVMMTDGSSSWEEKPTTPQPRRRLSQQLNLLPDNKQERIVGGSPVGPNEYPFMAALYQYEIDVGIAPACGGSLITSSVVLTAAHCISAINAVELNRYDVNVDDGVERYTNLTKREHPDFNRTTVDNDVGLIKLPVPHGNPSLAALRQTPEIPEKLMIMGWGLTSYQGEHSDVMLGAQVKRVDDVECKASYPSENITDTMVCFAEQNTDSCQGDSGSPAVIVGQNVQVAVVSWGYSCADARYPGVYSRVDQAYDWIENTVCNDLSPEDCVDGKLPHVGADGQVLDFSCDDKPLFLGLGKKMKIRDCDWVGARPERRCKFYGDRYCPATCDIERCKSG